MRPHHDGQGLLDRRAASLATRPRRGDGLERRGTEVLVVAVHDERYGLPLRAVAEVVVAGPLTRVPDCSPAVLGISVIHGEPRTVLGAPRLLGMLAAERDAKTKDGPCDGYFVLLRRDPAPVALHVDAVDEIRSVDRVEPFGQQAKGDSGLLAGVTGDGLIIVEEDRIAAVLEGLASPGASNRTED